MSQKVQKVTSNIVIEDARIGFRNFSGKEGKYNPVGRRHFSVFLDTEHAKQLEKDGWNVRWLKPRDEEEEPQAILQVTVKFDPYPPRVMQVTSHGKTPLDEDTINVLDWAEIVRCDLSIRPYNWEYNDRRGVKGYLKSLYVTIAEDEFEGKYTNTPDSAISSTEEKLPFE